VGGGSFNPNDFVGEGEGEREVAHIPAAIKNSSLNTFLWYFAQICNILAQYNIYAFLLNTGYLKNIKMYLENIQYFQNIQMYLEKRVRIIRTIFYL
jgi:hypothetical protein